MRIELKESEREMMIIEKRDKVFVFLFVPAGVQFVASTLLQH